MNPPPNSPASRPGSPLRCSICMDDLSPNSARLMPCGHEFDLECTAALIKRLEKTSKICPLCRTRIVQVQWNFKPDSNYQYFVLGSGFDDAGPFIREDEEIREDMDEAEKSRRRDLRRLRAKEDASFNRGLKWFAQVNEGGNMVSVSRSVILDVEQIGIVTETKLIHTLELYTRYVREHSLADRTHANKPEDIAALAKARAQIKTFLEKIGHIHISYTNLELRTPTFHIKRDAKNLHVDAHSVIHISKPEVQNVGHEHIIIRGTQYLWEGFPDTPPSEIRHETDETLAHGLQGPARRRGVNIARQQINSAIQRFDSVLLTSTADMFVAASTGIFDDVPGHEKDCGYCDEKHQNGECLLPEIASDGSDSVELTWGFPGEGGDAV